jgi:hypothetical protein
VLPTKFQLIWPNGFKEDFFKMAHHKRELHMVAILVVQSPRNMEILYRIFHTPFLQSNNSLCLLVTEKIFKISANQKQKLPMATMLFVQSR